MKNDALELHIIYNICGISGRDNTDYYIKAINTIIAQTYTNYKLIISACLNTDKQLSLINQLAKVDMIVHTKDILPVNITFNHAVNKSIEKFGKPFAVLYLDSGVMFTQDDQLENLVRLFYSGDYGMVSAQVDNDMGWCWFNLPVNTVINKDFLVPVGRALNLHCQLFHIDIWNRYGKIIPDIFRSYCTESVFSFINASIKKQWAVSGKVKLHHAMDFPNGDINNGDGLDGHSSGFKAPHGTWDDVFPPHSMSEIISNKEANLCGLGFEELRHIMPHNKDCYNEDQSCKDPERLARYIATNLYRQEKDFNYKNIKYEVIC